MRGRGEKTNPLGPKIKEKKRKNGWMLYLFNNIQSLFKVL